MKLFKKQKGYKTTEFVINDIKQAVSYLVSQRFPPSVTNSIYAITITNTGCKHQKDLNHIITNKLFNTIKNDYKTSKEHTNYVFVIEYPEVITRGNYLPTNCKVHSHLVVNTSLDEKIIMSYLKQAFPKIKDIDMLIENITDRNDKEQYKNYLVKQGINNRILCDSSYNYKITLFDK